MSTGRLGDGWLLGLLLVIYLVGIAGFILDPSNLFVRLTPLNLALTAYVLWSKTQLDKSIKIWLWAVGVIGFVAEVVGVNTGWLFGEYAYDYALGYKVLGVPLMISLNWAMVVYCSCGTVGWFWARGNRVVKTMLAAAIVTALDAVIEPVAMEYGFWHWADGQVPLYNYLCWFGLSLGFSWVYFRLNRSESDFLAPGVFLLQFLFFGVLGIYS